VSRSHRRLALQCALAAALGVTAALLVACGSSGSVLIPLSEAGPLRADVEAVEHAAESGDGNCGQTEKALLKTDQDYAALPSSIDAELRNRLHLGIENLHKVATEACEQPIAKTVTTQATSSPPHTTTSTTTPTVSTNTSTATPPVAPTEPTEEPGAGGGTPAPGEGQGKSPGEGVGGAEPEEAAGGVVPEGTK
jgi:hypothetical protein